MKRTPLKPSTKILPRREQLQRSAPLVAKAPMKKRREGTRRTEAVRDSDWLQAVRDIPCCVRCRKFGVQAAHRDEGKGFGTKTDDALTAAICPDCHRELGEGKDMDRATRRAEMNHWIIETLKVLARGLYGWRACVVRTKDLED
jgi:hypothetical protein